MNADRVHTYRSPGMWWTSLVFAVGFGGYCMAYGLLALFNVVDIGGPRSPSERIEIALVFVALALLSVGLWWRLGRARMQVDDREVIVVNPLRTYVLPRSTVTGMRPTSANGWVFLITTDRGRIPVLGLSVGLRWTLRRRLAEVASESGIPLL